MLEVAYGLWMAKDKHGLKHNNGRLNGPLVHYLSSKKEKQDLAGSDT